MVLVTLSPEGVRSFRELPPRVKADFDSILLAWQGKARLRLPGEYPTHELEGGRGMWILKVGTYRGVYRWDGSEARFIRFGHRRSVYVRLPK